MSSFPGACFDDSYKFFLLSKLMRSKFILILAHYYSLMIIIWLNCYKCDFLMLKQIQKRVTFVRFYTSEKKLDHYAVLGVKSDATAKDIKSAFYSLSKKYHPDKNPDNPEKAAEQFQKVVAAYEALGTEERRRAYDSTIAPRYSGPHIYTRHPASASSTKRHREYTDIDIDYKDFEQFQKSNRFDFHHVN
uniref:J domain-containing protein n=1 Tax=Panagrolaimus sp. JU765 TaxID=591449 RepID=A0AC34RIN2_9BILA